MNKITVIVFLSLLSIAGRGQGNNNIDITGKVYDQKTGVGLPGATVHIKGTTHEVVTEKRSRMILRYDTSDGSRVILSGINENRDSVYIVLDRINRNFALGESSLQAGKY